MKNKKSPKLFMILLGCKPKGRHTEQHDVFFGIADSPKDLVPQLINFWPEAAGKLHIDAWRELNYVNGFAISVVEKSATSAPSPNTLFFINLGGYTRNVFDEQHYIILSVAPDKASAIAHAKQTVFYKEVHFDGASSHIDDQYAIDVDDLYAIEDILSPSQKEQYSIQITTGLGKEDEIHLGYFKLSTLP